MQRKTYQYYLASMAAFTTFLVYLPALRNDFIELDDAVYVLDNPFIRSFNGTLVRWALFHFYAANWHPLAWISHALDYSVWGLNPLGHHLTSIILHAVNTFVVVLLAARLLGAGEEKTTEAKPPAFLNERMILIAAGVTGLLFGLHPVHVESVAWIAERKDLLCALFFLLSIFWYAKYADFAVELADSKNMMSRYFNNQYLVTLGFFVLALLSKPMAVSLPIVLLILDWYPFNRIHSFPELRAAVVEKLPLVALSIASSVLTILAQGTGKAIVSIDAIPLSARMLMAVKSLSAYLFNMAFPHDLTPLYVYPRLTEIALSRGEYLLAAVLFIGITMTCILLVNRQRSLLSAWGYYVITLLPVLGIVQVGAQSMADRYTYLPSLGPFLIAGLGAGRLFSPASAAAKRIPFVQFLGAALVVVLLLFLSSLTVRQIRIWKNSFVMLDYVLEKTPRKDPVVYFHRAVAFEKKGRADKAVEDYTSAISLNPSYYEAFFSRGTTYEKLGKLDSAIEDYGRAIILNPSYSEAYTNRGILYKKTGLVNKAAEDFIRAIAANQASEKAFFNLGVIHAEAGLFTKAIEDFDRAIAIDGTDANAYANRGIVNALIGRYMPALDDFNKAIAQDRKSTSVYYNRGKLYSTIGQNELAFIDFRKACELGDVDGCNALQSRLK